MSKRRRARSKSAAREVPHRAARPAHPPRRWRPWLLAAVLVALMPLTWAMMRLSSRADSQLLVEAAAAMDVDPRLAEEILQLVKRTDNPAHLAALTEARVRQEHWPEAEAAARDWTKAAPSSSAPWSALGEIERRQKKVVSSRASFETALTLTTDRTQRDALHSKLFSISLTADDAVGARQHLESIENEQIRQSHLNSLAYAHLLRLEGKHSQAQQLVTQHIDADSDPAPALMLRGIILLDLGNYAAAASDLSAVVAAQPDNKEAHYKLAIALRSLQRLDESKKHFQISQELEAAAQRSAP